MEFKLKIMSVQLQLHYRFWIIAKSCAGTRMPGSLDENTMF